MSSARRFDGSARYRLAMTAAERQAAGRLLAAILDQVAHGELVAPPTMIARVNPARAWAAVTPTEEEDLTCLSSRPSVNGRAQSA
jgi:hypothetical protein